MNGGFSEQWHAWSQIAGQLWTPTAPGASVPALRLRWSPAADVPSIDLLMQGLVVSVVASLSEHALNMEPYYDQSSYYQRFTAEVFPGVSPTPLTLQALGGKLWHLCCNGFLKMLQACSPSHDWFCDSEPLLFDDDFCMNLMKDLQSIPTPPQSPPIKPGLAKNLSSVDQLELVSEILMEDSDFLQMDWNFTGGAACADDPLSDACLWRTDKPMEDKLSAVLSTSPLLSDIDTQIFAEIAGSTLDCHNVALACQALGSEEIKLESQEMVESTSDYGSLSTGGESSTSDSEEEIDVVTVWRACPLPHSRHREQLDDDRLRALHFEIQQQHNYAAPRPASPPPPPPSAPPLKRTRSSTDSQRSTQSSGRSRNLASRLPVDTEDEEERRRTHNVMERQRRNELKNCFQRLRDNVPELSNNDKASKVVILKRAKDSIRNLETENHRLSTKRENLRVRQEQLKARLERLKRL
ncbi:hypothetical protein DNTS_016326 [Danionella cerebrum]|uniref:BHLH domain-containing protein n=1 Tax=Danionella cerebrum TaxID=2873325 RepID=A0A553QHX1_9TELE|nr:hypothetical protein DNTS_016326 [Danionella translucida]